LAHNSSAQVSSAVLGKYGAALEVFADEGCYWGRSEESSEVVLKGR